MFLFLFRFTSLAETITVKGTGGVVDLPGGIRCYCPTYHPTAICAIIRKNVTGIPEYPDKLTHYDESGNPLETVNVRQAEETYNGQPTWWVQPPGVHLLKKGNVESNAKKEKK